MQFRWIEWNRDHLDEHGVDWEEAEAVVRQAKSPFPQQIGDEKAGPLTLLEHASEIVAINVETGEYILGRTVSEVLVAFRKRWPKQLAYFIRVDGGPVAKFHGM